MQHYYFSCNLSNEYAKMGKTRRHKQTKLVILVESDTQTNAEQKAQELIQSRPNYSGNVKLYNLTLKHIDNTRNGMVPVNAVKLRR